VIQRIAPMLGVPCRKDVAGTTGPTGCAPTPPAMGASGSR
jgi:hypothetical protein